MKPSPPSDIAAFLFKLEVVGFFTCSCLGDNKGTELILGSQSLALSLTNGLAEGLLTSASLLRRALRCSSRVWGDNKSDKIAVFSLATIST